MTSRFSLLAALVLAICFVLPLSTCTRYVDAEGEAVEVERGETPPEGHAVWVIGRLGETAPAAWLAAAAVAALAVGWLAALVARPESYETARPDVVQRAPEAR